MEESKLYPITRDYYPINTGAGGGAAGFLMAEAVKQPYFTIQFHQNRALFFAGGTHLFPNAFKNGEIVEAVKTCVTQLKGTVMDSFVHLD